MPCCAWHSCRHFMQSISQLTSHLHAIRTSFCLILLIWAEERDQGFKLTVQKNKSGKHETGCVCVFSRTLCGVPSMIKHNNNDFDTSNTLTQLKKEKNFICLHHTFKMSSVGAGAVRSGWLTKKAEKLGRSKKRYFALVPSQGALYYYDKGNDDSGAAPKVISVASLQLPPAIPTPAFRFPPSLHHPIANPGRYIYVIYFGHPSSSERSKWEETLHLQSHKMKSPSSIRSERGSE